jgi:hypothetical protein
MFYILRMYTTESTRILLTITAHQTAIFSFNSTELSPTPEFKGL